MTAMEEGERVPCWYEKLRRPSKTIPFKEILFTLLVSLPGLSVIFANIFILLPFGIQYLAAAPGDSSNSTKPNDLFVISRNVYSDFYAEDPRFTTQVLKTVFFAAAAFGSIVSGILSDSFGRRLVTLSWLSWSTIALFLVTVASSMASFAAVWALVAFGIMGAYSTTYVRVSELLTPKSRLIVMLIFSGTTWGCSHFLGTFLAYACSNWRTIAFALGLILCTILLLSHLNKEPIYIKERQFSEQERVAGNDIFYHVFTKPKLLKRTLALCFCWFISGLFYYGFLYSRRAPFFKGFHANIVFYGFIDLCAECLSAAIVVKTGRSKAVFTFFMILNGICAFVLAPFEDCVGPNGKCLEGSTQRNIVVLATHFTNLFSGGAALNFLWAITTAAFPTRMRNTAVGICSSQTRFGGIVGILLVGSGHIYGNWVALVAIGLLSWVSGVVMMLFVPEKANLPLWSTFKEETSERWHEVGPVVNRASAATTASSSSRIPNGESSVSASDSEDGNSKTPQTSESELSETDGASAAGNGAGCGINLDAIRVQSINDNPQG